MLTKADDYPIHQTPEPIAYSGTDRNFYDRYWFNGFEPDGSLFFLVGMGIYPHLTVNDAGISIQVDGKQYCLRASAVLKDRMNLAVGPIRLEIVDSLQVLRVVVEKQDGIAADLTFTGRAFPIEEPRFMRRVGTRGFMDYTRLTQNGSWSGWVSIDGRRIELSGKAAGTRDRSWGTRPIGASDQQINPLAGEQGYFWQWTPLNFKDKSLFFHIAAEPSGHIWNTRSVLAPDGAGPDAFLETENASMDTTLTEGTLWPARGTLTVDYGTGPYTVTLEPFHRMQMKGIGYFHPEWYHGRYHGALKVEREDFTVADLDPMKLENLHVQLLSKVTLTAPDGSVEQSVGVFEQAILGAYRPLGVTSNMDITRWDKED
ncbi:MAG: hypothetical protein M0R03_17860 [Novosphingobium sp.]|nr:hypothetical protein [Novosphingobium sp.]